MSAVESRQYSAFLGRNNSDYVIREVEGLNQESKTEHRNEIMKFFKEVHPPKPMRFFGLPGARWIFENEVMANFPASTCIGIERDRAIYETSRLWMPGRNRENNFWRLMHDGEFEYSDAGDSRIAHIGMRAFVSLGRGDFVSNKSHGDFVHRWKRWSAIWLDFTGMIHSEIEYVLPRLSAWCGSYSAYPQVPVAVTVMAARERLDVQARMELLNSDRTEYICKFLNAGHFRSFSYSHNYKHQSSVTPMLTVFGTLVRPEESVKI